MNSVINQLRLLKACPRNGVAIFTGYVFRGATEQGGAVNGGKMRKMKFTSVFEPPVPITQRKYKCDERFHTEDLYEDLAVFEKSNAVGYVIVDGHHSVVGVVSGSRAEVVYDWNKINLPRKHSKGGQSANRFANIRIEKRNNFITKLSEAVNGVLLSKEKDSAVVEKIVLGGSASLKRDFFQSDVLDYRLRKLVVKPFLDLPYGGKFGFQLAIQMSKELLRGLQFAKEEALVRKLLDDIQVSMFRSSIYEQTPVVYGIGPTMKCLEMRCIKRLVLSTELQYVRVEIEREEEKIEVEICQGEEDLEKVKEKGKIVSKQLYLEYLVNNYKSLGVDVVDLVSENTGMGKQFGTVFGGISGYLQYKIEQNIIYGTGEEMEGEEYDSGDDSDDPFGCGDLMEMTETRKKSPPKMKKAMEKPKSTPMEPTEKNQTPTNVIFIGHVDHGKSTIAGQLLLQCNVINERQLLRTQSQASANGMEAWTLAYLVDSSEEERERGKTVEVARTFFTTPLKNTKFCLLDAPGHATYIPSMVESSFCADVGVLVVSARGNEFEKGLVGQTKEHAFLAKSMGLNRLIVTVNKMDTIEWNRKRYDKIVSKMRKFLTGLTFKLSNVVFVPVDALNGDNFLGSCSAKWYKGKTLIEVLENFSELPVLARNRAKRIEKPLIFTVVDHFVENSLTSKVVGKIVDGKVEVGQKLFVNPSMSKDEDVVVTVKFIESHMNRVDVAFAGDMVDLTLKMEKKENNVLGVGSILTDDPGTCRTTTEILAEIFVVKKEFMVTSELEFILHSHTCTEPVELEVVAKYEGKKKKKKRIVTKEGKTGENVIVKLKFDNPICTNPYDISKDIGRFVLRDETTVAVGKVLKVLN